MSGRALASVLTMLRSHSCCSSFPSVSLCFSPDFPNFPFFVPGSTCSGRGLPMRSRASAFTAVTARNGFGFFFFGIVLEVYRKLVCARTHPSL
jgi:hypothetical protein